MNKKPPPSSSRRFGSNAPKLTVTYRPLAELKPLPGNPRSHGRKQIRQIGRSLVEFGWALPIVVDANMRVIIGTACVAAAGLLGMEEVPVVVRDDLTEAQIRALRIAANKLAENAEWDRAALRTEFLFLATNDVHFDLTLTGFEIPEIDLVIGEPEFSETDDVVDAALPAEDKVVSRLGDAWQIGRHRLVCGDARDPRAYTMLLKGERAEMVFTDPPYNVQINGHAGGLGANTPREFVMASGEMSEAEYQDFLVKVQVQLARHSLSGSLHFLCIDWRHTADMIAAGEQAYTKLKNICVWVKTNAGMGSLYRSQHEFVCVFKSGTAPHINNVELGKHGRHRTNVWEYAGANALHKDRAEELAMHPTMKPVAMVADAIFDCSRRNGIILDVFSGSGTTLLAAERTGRRGYGIELDPLYVDVAIRRYQKQAGDLAIHDETGLTFDQLAEIRQREAQDV